MAQRRMFNKTITNGDDFLEMPMSSQVLYFHLSMNADDDGFINNWKSIMRMTGTKEDDLKVLIAKQYIIPFDSGVIVIKHWRLNNYLQKDRITPTQYQEELKKLQLDNNNVYKMYTKCIHSIDKYRLDKNNKEKEIYKEKEKYGEFENVLLTKEEYAKLEKSNLLPYIEKLSSYIASKGKKYKSHYATILTWSRKDTKNEDIGLPDWFNKDLDKDYEGQQEMEDILKDLEE